MQRDDWYSIARDQAAIASPESIGERAAQRALSRLGARKVKTCRVPVLFEAPLAPSFDEYRSICGAYSIADAMLHFLGKENGILHLGGDERLSRYDFGEKVTAVFGLDKNLLNACSQEDIQFSYQRPKDVSLNSTKANSLGFSPKGVTEELNEIKNLILGI